jgi:hypothetical protein
MFPMSQRTLVLWQYVASGAVPSFFHSWLVSNLKGINDESYPNQSDDQRGVPCPSMS